MPEAFLAALCSCLGSALIAAEQSCFPPCRLCPASPLPCSAELCMSPYACSLNYNEPGSTSNELVLLPEGRCIGQQCSDRATSRSARQPLRMCSGLVDARSGISWVVCVRYLLWISSTAQLCFSWPLSRSCGEHQQHDGSDGQSCPLTVLHHEVWSGSLLRLPAV